MKSTGLRLDGSLILAGGFNNKKAIIHYWSHNYGVMRGWMGLGVANRSVRAISGWVSTLSLHFALQLEPNLFSK